MMAKYNDLTGQSFGKLTVIRMYGRNEKGTIVWECTCNCGGKAYPVSTSLVSGNTKSCGCTRNEKIRMVKYKHGHNLIGKRSSEHIIWANMINRCTNPNSKDYKYYGGRGISVCERWRTFENFLLDMGKRPSKLYSLDRIDVNGDYSPDNCKWSTEIEQNRNRRSNNVHGHPGIGFEKSSNKFRPYIGVNGKTKFLGRFDTLNEAIEARKQAEIKYWGKSS